MADQQANGADHSELRALSVLADRLRWSRQMGFTFEGQRDTYKVFGYPQVLTIQDYREKYERGGIAKRIVECFPKATWRGGVELFEDEDPAVSTEFEQAWDAVNTRLNIWTTLQKADILAGLSTYSVILIGAPGDLSTELPRGTPDKLLYLQPFLAGGGPGQTRSTSQMMAFDADCSILEFDVNAESPRFGEPLSYQLRRTSIVTPMFARPVHWSRILHICEGALDDNVYGVPTLQNVFNLLLDLEKITGGGAEAFFLRANAGLQIDVDKDMTLSPNPAEAAATMAHLLQQVEDYKHNITRVMRTQGVSINQLGSDVANFDNPAQAILTQIAGSKGIPMRILTGSERGELASTQDAANFNTQVQDRRTGYAGPMIVRRLVDRLIKYGYLPTPKQYDVSWPTIETMSDTEKAQGAKLWADTAAGGKPVYTISEIREHWQNLSPLTEEQKAEMAPPAPPEPEVLPAADGGVAAGEGDLVALEHKLSTTQFNLPNELAKKFLAFEIDEDDLALKGREAKPHVTVKYGLHTQLPQNVRRVVSDYGPVSVEMGKTAIFAGPEYDVLYVEVESDDLVALNALLSEELKTTDTHPTYVPHACIAYLKPGRGEKYVGRDDFEGEAVTFDEVQFSPADTLITLEDDELIRILAAAIESGATEVVDAIVGVRRAEIESEESDEEVLDDDELKALGAPDGHPFYGNQWTEGGDLGIIAKEYETTGYGPNDVSGQDKARAAAKEAHKDLVKAGFVKNAPTEFKHRPSEKMGRSTAYTGSSKSSETNYTHPDGRTAKLKTDYQKYRPSRVVVRHVKAPGGTE